MTKTIKMSLFGTKPEDRFHPAQHPWTEKAYLQGGRKGLVVARGSNESYITAFVEAFIDDGDVDSDGFYRGEGSTVEEAETNAWQKYQAAIECAKTGHDYEPRGYRNGCGICKKCQKFSSKIFTGEQLGQYCEVVRDCNKGSLGDTTVIGHERLLACDDHASIGSNAFAKASYQLLSLLTKDYPEAATDEERQHLRVISWAFEDEEDALDEEELEEVVISLLKNL